MSANGLGGHGLPLHTCEFDDIVSENAVPAPDPRAGVATEPGAAPHEVAFEARDPPLAASTPLDRFDELCAPLNLDSRGGRLTGTGNNDNAHTGTLQIGLDAGIPVTPIGGEDADSARQLGADPGKRRSCQLSV